MDATTFDTLIKRLATTPLTRVNVLRGLAASAAALTGVMLPKEAGAKKKDETEIKVCNCPGSDASSCKTQKKDKSKAKKLLQRNPCAYKGKCQGVSGCAAGTDPLSPPPPGRPPPPGGPPPPPGSGPRARATATAPPRRFARPEPASPVVFPVRLDSAASMGPAPATSSTTPVRTRWMGSAPAPRSSHHQSRPAVQIATPPAIWTSPATSMTTAQSAASACWDAPTHRRRTRDGVPNRAPRSSRDHWADGGPEEVMLGRVGGGRETVLCDGILRTLSSRRWRQVGRASG